MNPRRLAALAAFALFAIPAGAHAKTYCVADASCADPKPTIADAVAAAALNGGPDEIRVGPGTFDESFTYAGDGPLTITGAGRGVTRIASAPKKEWVVDLERTTISDLSIRARVLGPASTGALRLDQSTARGIGISQDGDREAAELGDGSLLEDAVVAGPAVAGGEIVARCPSGCDVRRTSIDSRAALYAIDASRLRAEDIRARGAMASLDGSTFDLRRAVVAPSGEVPFGLLTFTSHLDARQTTIVRRGSGADTVGAMAIGDAGKMLQPGDGGSLTLDSVAIDGFSIPVGRNDSVAVLRRAQEAVPARLVARDSAWERSTEQLAPEKPGLELGHLVDLAGRSPGFRDAASGDVGLRADSPLIDGVLAGLPAAFRDLDGKPAVDGDGDGVVRADIGAFEGPARPRTEPPPAPAPATTAAPLTATSLRAALDGVAPRLTRLRLSKGRLLVRLSERARLRITISRRARGGAFRRVRTVTVTAKRGDNRIALRLPKRRGAYRVAVVARDLAGNASPQQRLALHVR